MYTPRPRAMGLPAESSRVTLAATMASARSWFQAVRWASLIAGPLAAASCYALLPGAEVGGLSAAGRGTTAVAVWMALWWLTEAIPIAATALLPVTVLPLLGARSIEDAASSYAHYLIFLFLGGFVVALSMERWGLHRRIALRTLQLVGTRPQNVVGGFMVVTAALSMWTSNTATAIAMLPIAASVVRLVAERHADEQRDADTLPARTHNFALCMMLGIAYGASIGGIGTLIGTPPNLFLASYVREHLDHEIGFAQWMSFGLPLVAVLLPAAWLMLTRVLYPPRFDELPGGRGLLRREHARLGAPQRGEIITLAVFVTMAVAWLVRPLLKSVELAGVHPFAGLSDAGIALCAALVLFVIPVEPKRRVFVMDWETARKLPWGILVLFGGGLSLAAAMQQTGVTAFVGRQVQGLAGVSPVLIVIAVTAAVVFLTEVTSNTATTAAFIPILAGVSSGLDMHPYALIVPTALAASAAFMMPVATPPNAVVFGSRYVTIPEMARAGVWLNIVAIALISAFAWWLALPLLGV